MADEMDEFHEPVASSSGGKKRSHKAQPGGSSSSLPLQRVRNMMRMNDRVAMVTTEAAVLMTRAAEQFIGCDPLPARPFARQAPKPLAPAITLFPALFALRNTRCVPASRATNDWDQAHGGVRRVPPERSLLALHTRPLTLSPLCQVADHQSDGRYPPQPIPWIPARQKNTQLSRPCNSVLWSEQFCRRARHARTHAPPSNCREKLRD